MTICATVLKRSAIFASLPAAEKSALLLEGATALPQDLQQFLTNSEENS